MKFNIKNSIVFPLALCTLLVISSCGSKDNHSHNDENTKETGTSDGHTHEEETPTIATLTQEQIKAVGITLGKVENKELTATIKANGMLKVPNNNKANATSLYGGVIKTLNVQIGDYVKKGQVIATIANPQFIQLQEEYLTIGSKITFAEQEVQRQNELNAGNAGALKNLQNATAELNTLRTRKASLQQLSAVSFCKMDTLQLLSKLKIWRSTLMLLLKDLRLVVLRLFRQKRLMCHAILI